MTTFTRTRPVAGMGFGQKGYAGNRHFATLELAQAAFDKYCREIREIYGKPGRQWTGRFVEERYSNDRVISGIRFIPLNKDGKRGARIHTVYLYPIDEQQAERFLSDPFYCCESR